MDLIGIPNFLQRKRNGYVLKDAEEDLPLLLPLSKVTSVKSSEGEKYRAYPNSIKQFTTLSYALSGRDQTKHSLEGYSPVLVKGRSEVVTQDVLATQSDHSDGSPVQQESSNYNKMKSIATIPESFS